ALRLCAKRRLFVCTALPQICVAPRSCRDLILPAMILALPHSRLETAAAWLLLRSNVGCRPPCRPPAQQERNREHAKRSRIRKKFLLECLQEQLMLLRKENMNLRQVVKERMPTVATQVFEKCINEKALVLSGKQVEEAASALAGMEAAERRREQRLLVEPDFQLIQCLMDSQQNFTVSDPALPDNPIVYASQGFLKLTGYTMDKVIGRNCRFLQGPGTDQRAVDIIRRGIADGRDTSVCLLNYQADGTPFWNQFFIAALRDAAGKVVNFVGVQCEVRSSHYSFSFLDLRFGSRGVMVVTGGKKRVLLGRAKSVTRRVSSSRLMRERFIVLWSGSLTLISQKSGAPGCISCQFCGFCDIGSGLSQVKELTLAEWTQRLKKLPLPEELMHDEDDNDD
ncbi:unnamed protein product, partial [Phaeothamnion confervicola]